MLEHFMHATIAQSSAGVMLSFVGAITLLLHLVDRLWYVRDPGGKWVQGSPWRWSAHRAREALRRTALGLWSRHSIDVSRRLAEGLFYTLIWLFVLLLNYVIVAQILDIFIPSSVTMYLPGVGHVGEAAAATAPIVILVAMVAGIAVHVAWRQYHSGRATVRTSLTLAAALAFAAAFPILESLGSKIRWEMTQGIVALSEIGIMGGASSGMIVSMLLGFIVPFAVMFPGVKSFDLFLGNFIASVFYRSQAILLWIVCGWLYVIARKPTDVIHARVVELDMRAERLEHDLRGAAGKLTIAMETVKSLAGKARRLKVRVPSAPEFVADEVAAVEADVADVTATADVVGEWMETLAADRDSLSRFSSAHTLHIRTSEGLDLSVELPPIRDTSTEQLLARADELRSEFLKWLDLFASARDSSLSSCEARVNAGFETVAALEFADRLKQQAVAFEKDEYSRLVLEADRVRDTCRDLAEEVTEWLVAINLALEKTPATRGPAPNRQGIDESILRKLEAINYNTSLGWGDLLRTRFTASEVMRKINRLQRELVRSLNVRPAEVQSIVSQVLTQVVDILDIWDIQVASHGFSISELGDRLKTCREEIARAKHYLCGQDNGCAVPRLDRALKHWRRIAILYPVGSIQNRRTLVHGRCWRFLSRVLSWLQERKQGLR